MSCYCDFNYDYVVVRECWVKAHKKHRCIECRAEILPGERYLAATGVGADDGLFAHYPTCLTCGRIREDLIENDGYCITYGRLWDFVDMEFEDPE